MLLWNEQYHLAPAASCYETLISVLWQRSVTLFICWWRDQLQNREHRAGRETTFLPCLDIVTLRAFERAASLHSLFLCFVSMIMVACRTSQQTSCHLTFINETLFLTWCNQILKRLHIFPSTFFNLLFLTNLNQLYMCHHIPSDALYTLQRLYTKIR